MAKNEVCHIEWEVTDLAREFGDGPDFACAETSGGDR